MSSAELETPFLLALVDLEGDIGRLTARLDGIEASELSIGMPLRLILGDLETEPPYIVVPNITAEEPD